MTSRKAGYWRRFAPPLAAAGLAIAISTDIGSFAVRLHRSAAIDHPRADRSLRAFPTLRIKPLPGIVAAHLFGRAELAASQVAMARGSLKLVGVIATERAQEGAAIIVTPDGASHLFRTGSPVASDLTLSEVFADRVVLVGDGASRTLLLSRLRSDGIDRSGALPPLDEVADDVNDDAADAGTLKPGFVPPPLPTSGAILRSLHLRPAMEAGTVTGMRVEGINGAQKSLAALGLNAGDVIVSINGGAEGQPSIPGILMNTINAGQPATLAVERGGRLIDVTIDPDSADAAANVYRNSVPQ